MTLYRVPRKWMTYPLTAANCIVPRCAHCHGRKAPGKGKRLCETCEPVRVRDPLCRACRSAPVAPRCQYCAECGPLRLEVAIRRSNRRKSMARRKLCRGGCGRLPGRAPSGRSSPYCARCRREHFARPSHTCLHCDVVLQGTVKVCPDHRHLVQCHPSRTRSRPLPKWLPGEPLAAVVNLHVARLLANPENTLTSPQVYERVGVMPRMVYAWAHEGRRAKFEVADRVVTALGLRLEDVWPELA